MKSLIDRRKWLVALCVALLFFAAMSAPDFTLVLAPAPLWLLIAILPLAFSGSPVRPLPSRPAVQRIRLPRPPPPVR